MKLVTRKSTKFQPKAKTKFGLGFRLGFKTKTSSGFIIQSKHKTNQALRLGLTLASLILITFLSPLFKKSFRPQTANAANPTITRLSQTIGQPSGGDKIVIQGSEFIQDIKFTQISATGSHSCAIGVDNRAYCWGINNFG